MLDGDELRYKLLDLPHRCHASLAGVVLQVAAPAAREPRQARGTIPIAFIQHKGARGLIEDFQQPVHIHERHVVNRQEIGGARRVGRPPVGVDVEQWVGRRRRPSILYFHAAPSIEVGEFALTPQLD